MKKRLPLFILCLLTLSGQAQWQSEASGFLTAGRGISQVIVTDKNTAWATAFDATTNLLTACRDYTHTTDAGNTWTAATLTAAPASFNWSCMSAINGDTAWAMLYNTTAGGGRVYRTNDGGSTWTQQTIFGSTSFPDVIHFWNENTGVAVGDPVSGEFEIYTTNDGGTTWTAVPGANIPDPNPGEYCLTRSLGVNGNIIWLGTTEGRMLKSTDYGATWTVYDVDNINFVIQLAFEDENNGCVELQDGVTGAFMGILRTTDGGTTWNDITPVGTFFNFWGLTWVPTTTSTLVACGSDDASLSFGSQYSLDGGDTWITIDSAVFHFAVSFLDNLTGWSGGVSLDNVTDGMWKYTDAFVSTGVQAVDQNNFKFNLYPNPGDGLFYFSFDAQNNQTIHIRVTDAVGSLVFDKIYKDKSQTWLRSIDLRSFSKGIYFLDLENNGNHTSQKLVIN